MSESNPPVLEPRLVLLMALATGIAVASNYYAQPLLHSIAVDFGVSFAQAGMVVTTAQLSYATGLLLLVPLGDLLERRRLIVGMLILAALGLSLSAFASNLPLLLLGTAVTGLFSVVAQVLVPFAATLAHPEERGKVIGSLMTGLLLGILLARTVAGSLSSLGDWQAVYGLAAGMMLIMAAALYRNLPEAHPSVRLSYPQLLLSVAHLLRDEPIHRQRTLLGFLCFTSFALFWTPLAFLLSSPPYEYSDALIGVFGLVGAAGALSANWAGRMADRGRAALVTTAMLVLVLLSWVVLSAGGSSVLALILGILMLDLAVQGCHVSNQNTIYRLQPEARNRLNAGYMTGYFLGGAIGSLLSSFLYQHQGWLGVCIAGGLISILALGVWWKGHKLESNAQTS